MQSASSKSQTPMNSRNTYLPDHAVSPGDVLDEHREAIGLTQAELAQRIGFSPKHVNRLLAGLEPVTPETALKLEPKNGKALKLLRLKLVDFLPGLIILLLNL